MRNTRSDDVIIDLLSAANIPINDDAHPPRVPHTLKTRWHMNSEDTHDTPGRLTRSQATRIEFARRDLDDARGEDLAQLPPAGLVRLVERLRLRLHDTLTVVDEITHASPHIPPNEHP